MPLSGGGPLTIRTLAFGCSVHPGRTCVTCVNFRREDGAFRCGWIREEQRARGVKHPDDHVSANHPACGGYAPRLAIVENEQWREKAAAG